MKKQIYDVLCKALFLLFVMQILLGIHWMKGSLSTHMGIMVQRGGLLYVLVAPCLSRVGGFFCFIQTVIFLLVLDLFLQSIWKIKFCLRCVRVLGVLTCPGVLLTLFTLNPYGIAAMGLLLLMTLCIMTGNRTLSGRKGFCLGTVLMIFLPMWLQECFIFGAVVYLVLMIVCIRTEGEHRKVASFIKYLAILMITVIVSYGSVCFTSDSMQRSEDIKSVSEGLFVRLSRSNINKVYGNYSPEVKAVLDRETVGRVAEKPELVEELVIRPMKATYGSKKGTRLLLHMAGCNWEGYKRQIMSETCLDFLSYLATPAVVLYRLKDHGDNLMLKRLQEYFLLPSLRAGNVLVYLNAIIFVLGVILFIFSSSEKRAILLGFLFFAIFFSLWYTLQGGEMDYRKNILLTAMEMGAFMSVIVGEVEAEMEKLKNE